MGKQNIDQIIVRALQESASEKEMNIFYTWIESDEGNKKHYFQMKEIYDTRKIKIFSDNERFEKSWNILSQRIDEKSELSRNSKRQLFIRYASAAAAVVAILLTTLLFINNNNKSTEKWLESYNVPSGKPVEITLADGSTVKLNASSKLKYPEHFSVKTREVYLEGEAFFSIKKDLNKPFVVHSKNQKITVLGTVFNINSYPNYSFSETTLISGKVKLDVLDNDGKAKEEIIMGQNQQVRIDKETLATEVKLVDSDKTISWTNNEYVFRNNSFGEILDRLSSIHDVRFIASTYLKEQKYTGRFTSEQSLTEILDILNFKNQFTYTISDKTITIKDK